LKFNTYKRNYWTEYLHQKYKTHTAYTKAKKEARCLTCICILPAFAKCFWYR